MEGKSGIFAKLDKKAKKYLTKFAFLSDLESKAYQKILSFGTLMILLKDDDPKRKYFVQIAQKALAKLI